MIAVSQGRSWGLLLAGVLVGACGGEPRPPMRVGTIPWPSSEVMFLAQQRGWLDQLQFRLVEFVDESEAARAFRNQAVEAAWMSLDTLLEAADVHAADPVVLFVSDESLGGDAIMARPELGVTGLAGLAGRRLAVQTNTASAYFLDRALGLSGLAIGDVAIVNLPPYRHLSAFLGGEIDAAVTTEPVRTQIAAAGGVELYSSAATPFEMLRVLAVRRDYLVRYPATVQAVCEAWEAAYEELSVSDDARAWMAGRLGVSLAGLDGMLAVVRLVPLDESRRLFDAPGVRLLPTMALLQSRLLDARLMTAAIPLEPLVEWPAGPGGPCRSGA